MIGPESSPDWAAVWTGRIAPALAAKSSADDPLRWIFVCGQQGSGKSTAIDRLMVELGPDCTQRIAADDIAALLPELNSGTPDTIFRASYEKRGLQTLYDLMVSHAVELRANVVWEVPVPARIEDVAGIARALGYSVECWVIAYPALESFVSILRRSISRTDDPSRPSVEISWPFVQETCRRWPALVARAEAGVTFDRLAIIDRNGTPYHDNRAVTDAKTRRWSDPCFGFESLVTERARPRSHTQMAALLAEAQAIMAHPDIAFRNRPNWPWHSLKGVNQHLHDLAADPGIAFDLTTPGNDPVAGRHWIAGLRAELDEILTGPEAADQAGLSARADRLIALVTTLAGHITR